MYPLKSKFYFLNFIRKRERVTSLDDAQARAELIPSPDKYQAVDVTKFKARRNTIAISK
jgi:hypothetical protein